MLKNFLIFLGLIFSLYTAFAEKTIESPEHQILQRQIFMLEYAFAPPTPDALISNWMKAKKNRNGAVQYMILCPNLKKTHYENFKELNWVTGVSSPWVDNFKIISRVRKRDRFHFTIQYQLVSGGRIKSGVEIEDLDVISVADNSNSSQKWCIDSLKNSP